jgi:endoglucanase
MQIPVDLSHPSKTTITVHWNTVDGVKPGVASSQDGDFVAASGTLTYAYGVTRQYIPVTVKGDAKVEPNETLIVQLSQPTHATVAGNGQVTGIILNDD